MKRQQSGTDSQIPHPAPDTKWELRCYKIKQYKKKAKKGQHFPSRWPLGYPKQNKTKK